MRQDRVLEKFSRLVVGVVTAAFVLASCGDSGGGSDILNLSNPLLEPITVVVGFPGGGTETVTLSLTNTENKIPASYVIDQTFTFNATTTQVGIAPADPTACTVGQVAVDNGIASVQVFTPAPLGTQLQIECGGPGQGWQNF